MHFSFITPGVLALSMAVAFPVQASALREALDAAVARSAEAEGARVRGADIEARRERAGRWLAGPPELAGSYKSDAWADDRGLSEAELGVSVPLWLPGQRAASRAYAEDGQARSETGRIALRLALAGELRDSLWRVAASDAEAELARARVAWTRELAEDMARQVKAGEKAETDRLLAVTEQLAAERAAAEAEQTARAAQSLWRRLTGREPLAPEPETVAAAGEPDAHPALAALAAARREAKSALALAEADDRDAPSVGLAATRERAERNLPSESSLTLSFNIPLGARAEQGERHAELAARLAELDAEYVLTRDRLVLERADAERSLALAEQAARLAAEQRRLALQNRAHARRALGLGEIALLDFNRIDTLAFEAERGARLAELAVGAARARLNQALGVLPQ